MGILSTIRNYYRFKKSKVRNSKITLIGSIPKLGKYNEISVASSATMKLGCIRTEKNVLLASAGNGHMLIENCFFNQNCVVVCRNDIHIENGCLFGPNVMVYDHNHKFSYEGVSSSEFSIGHVHIGKNCWIGGGVTILKNTDIGDGCIIGAGAVVSGSIPSHSLVTCGGNRELIVKEIEVRPNKCL